MKTKNFGETPLGPAAGVTMLIFTISSESTHTHTLTQWEILANTKEPRKVFMIIYLAQEITGGTSKGCSQEIFYHLGFTVTRALTLVLNLKSELEFKGRGKNTSAPHRKSIKL